MEEALQYLLVFIKNEANLEATPTWGLACSMVDKKRESCQETGLFVFCYSL
jgi:hypothetical protein